MTTSPRRRVGLDNLPSVVVEMPACPICRGTDITASRTIERSEDGTTRDCRCRTCGQRFILHLLRQILA